MTSAEWIFYHLRWNQAILSYYNGVGHGGQRGFEDIARQILEFWNENALMGISELSLMPRDFFLKFNLELVSKLRLKSSLIISWNSLVLLVTDHHYLYDRIGITVSGSQKNSWSSDLVHFGLDSIIIDHLRISKMPVGIVFLFLSWSFETLIFLFPIVQVYKNIVISL